ncbi:MAG: protein kinase domain-containing protein, partial [Terriglobales bacterium]
MGHKVDASSDIYSLGCLMYETLCGEPPFQAANAVQIIFKHVNDEAPSLRKACKGFEVSQSIANVVEACLEKDPAKRPKSAADLAARLEKVAAGKSILSMRALRRFQRKNYFSIIGWGLTMSVVIPVLFLVFALFIYPRYFAPEWIRMNTQSKDLKDKYDYKGAIDLSQKALDLARANNAPFKDLDNICSTLSTYYVECHEFEKAADVYEVAANNALRVKDYRVAAVCLVDAARKVNPDDPGRASQLYLRGIQYEERVTPANSPELLAIDVEAARSLERCKNYTQAEETFRKVLSAIQINKTSILPLVQFDTYAGLGRCLRMRAENKEAIEMLDKALALATTEHFKIEEIESAKKWRA